MFNNDYELQNAYDEYFGKKEPVVEKVVEPTVKKPSTLSRLTANGNIDDLDKLGEILRKLLNAAWGSDWGTLSPDTSMGDNAEEIIIPQINYGINLREVTEGTNPKPTLMDTIDEIVDGVKTGDSFRIYRQSFDCIVEINFWDSTSKDCRTLMNNFEKLMMTYTGYLKSQGLSEIFFLKEVPSKYSLNYSDGMPMRCCYYFVRLERNSSVRVSQINNIEKKLLLKDSELSTENKKNSDNIDKIIYKL